MAEGVSKGRAMAFRILAGLFGAVSLVLTIPFVVGSFVNDEDSVHRVHNVGGAAGFGLLLSVPLVLLAWRPRQTAVFRVALAMVVASVIAALLGEDLISGAYFVGPVIIVVLLVIDPWSGDVLRFRNPRIEGLGLAALATVPAVIYALDQAEIMRSGDPMTDVTGHWEFHHWTGMAATALGLVLCGAVASFDARARRTAAFLVGGAAVVLGAVSLALPDLPSALRSPWEVFAGVWGVTYVCALGFRKPRATE
jgi:hypothetical protein